MRVYVYQNIQVSELLVYMIWITSSDPTVKAQSPSVKAL